MVGISFSVFGTLRVTCSDASQTPPLLGPTERAVMAALLFNPGEFVTFEEVAGLVWPADDAPKDPAHAVQTHVMRLRRHLGHEVVETSSHSYRAAVEREAVDVLSFSSCIARAEQAWRANDTAASELAYSAGLEQCRPGDPWHDLRHNVMVAGERARLDEVRLVAQERRGALALMLGRLPVGELERLVVEQPLRELRWVLLMRAQAMQGRQADALRSFTRARLALRDVGLDPGPELAEMEARVLRQDSSLLDAAAIWELVR